MPLVVRLFEPQSVTDDRPVAAKRAQPREQLQRDLDPPGSVLRLGQFDKKNHGWREGPLQTVLPSSITRLAFTLPVSQCRTKKEYCILSDSSRPLLKLQHWPV